MRCMNARYEGVEVEEVEGEEGEEGQQGGRELGLRHHNTCSVLFAPNTQQYLYFSVLLVLLGNCPVVLKVSPACAILGREGGKGKGPSRPKYLDSWGAPTPVCTMLTGTHLALLCGSIPHVPTLRIRLHVDVYRFYH